VKILVIGMGDSIHLAQWLRQFEGSEHEFRLVSSSPHRRLHRIIRELISSSPEQFSIGFVSRVMSLPLWIMDRLFSNLLRGALIASNAKWFKPDLVHVLEFQNGGYSYLRGVAISKTLSQAPLLLTPYGSDIYWFQRFTNHLPRIRELLTRADAISAECRRDEILATKYGFVGVFGPRIPAFGVMKLDESRSQNAIRPRIAVKGYQNHWGQALNALKAIESVASQLQDLEITLYSCNSVTVKEARRVAERTGLKIVAHPKGALSHDQVQKIFSESIALVALSTSDGQSASMVEAMANGAVPIHSRTSCCDEWMEEGKGGFLVDYDDVEDVAAKLSFIVNNPEFRAKAAKSNFLYLTVRLDSAKTLAAVHETYEMLKAP